MLGIGLLNCTKPTGDFGGDAIMTDEVNTPWH